MRTREENRTAIVEQFADRRDKLGDRFDTLVDEISDVRYEYMLKKDQLPKYPIGVLDANSIEQRRFSREEGMKWVLIKQKYGI